MPPTVLSLVACGAMVFVAMQLIKKLVGWFFTYPAYRDITETQSEGVVSILALALHADGEPHDAEPEHHDRAERDDDVHDPDLDH